MFVSSLIGIMVLTGLIIMGRAGGLNITRAFISDHMSEELRATGMSISDFVQYTARIIGPMTAGLLIDLFAIQSVFITAFAMSLVGVGIMVVYKIHG